MAPVSSVMCTTEKSHFILALLYSHHNYWLPHSERMFRSASYIANACLLAHLAWITCSCPIVDGETYIEKATLSRSELTFSMHRDAGDFTGFIIVNYAEALLNSTTSFNTTGKYIEMDNYSHRKIEDVWNTLGLSDWSSNIVLFSMNEQLVDIGFNQGNSILWKSEWNTAKRVSIPLMHYQLDPRQFKDLAIVYFIEEGTTDENDANKHRVLLSVYTDRVIMK